MEVLQVANGYLTFAISTGPLCLHQICLCGLWNVNLPVTVAAAAALLGFQRPLAVKEIRLLPHQEDPGGRARRSQEASRKQKEPGYLISGARFWPDFSVFVGEITQGLRAGKK